MPDIEKWVLLSTDVGRMAGRRVDVPLNIKFLGDNELEIDSSFE
jgi:hypothetical protein